MDKARLIIAGMFYLMTGFVVYHAIFVVGYSLRLLVYIPFLVVVVATIIMMHSSRARTWWKNL